MCVIAIKCTWPYASLCACRVLYEWLYITLALTQNMCTRGDGWTTVDLLVLRHWHVRR